ncbi:MAG: imelysin family protein, partial [Bacteroidota bacterium]
MNKFFYFLCFALVLLFSACGEDDDSRLTDNFDRATMLTGWADNIIVPGYTEFRDKSSALATQATLFNNDPSEENFGALQNRWLEAYRAWQYVAMFEIGKAESVLLLNQINIYPTDTEAIDNNLQGAEYNLELPSAIDQQGFPALDYLLFGLEDNEAAIYQRYTDASTGVAHRDYLLTVATRIENLAIQVLTDWTGNYRDAFVANAGNDANASVDRLVNDFLFHYEKHLRAGKVGIPAGIFSADKQPDLVEAR